MSIDFAELENRIMATIENRKMTRREVAEVYALGVRLRAYNILDWRRVNTAIVERWSVSGLTWIKREAWKMGLTNRSQEPHS